MNRAVALATMMLTMIAAEDSDEDGGNGMRLDDSSMEMMEGGE